MNSLVTISTPFFKQLSKWNRAHWNPMAVASHVLEVEHYHQLCTLDLQLLGWGPHSSICFFLVVW